MEAIDVISKYSNIRPHQFLYAGTKDRRAKTTQRVCICKQPAEKLHKVNQKLHGIAMGNFKYQHVSRQRVSVDLKRIAMA